MPLTDTQVRNAKPGKRPPIRRKGDRHDSDKSSPSKHVYFIAETKGLNVVGDGHGTRHAISTIHTGQLEVRLRGRLVLGDAGYVRRRSGQGSTSSRQR